LPLIGVIAFETLVSIEVGTRFLPPQRMMVEKLGSGFKVRGSGFKVQGSRFRVQGSGFKVRGSRFRVQGSGFRVQGSGFKVLGSRFKVLGSKFRVQGSGFKVQGSGFRVQGSRFRVRGSGFGIRGSTTPPPLNICTTSPFPLRAGPGWGSWFCLHLSPPLSSEERVGLSLVLISLCYSHAANDYNKNWITSPSPLRGGRGWG
jgi:hypothetical protein